MTDTVTKTDTTPATAPTDPKPGTPEYDAAMAALYRESKGDIDREVAARLAGKPADTPVTDKPKRPDHVPEKFWDAEKGVINTDALLKSYGELEKGKKPDETPAVEKPAEGDKPAEGEVSEGQVKDVVEKAGLKWDEVRTKIVEKGALEAADYTAFEKVGIPKAIVDDYINLAKYRQTAEKSAAETYIGGKEEADKLLGWAAQNLNDADKKAYNDMLAGAQWRVAVDALKAKRAGAARSAKEPQLLGGEGSGNTGTVGYQTRADMEADIANPVYNDPGPKGEKFRAEVFQKTRFAAWNRKSA